MNVVVAYLSEARGRELAKMRAVLGEDFTVSAVPFERSFDSAVPDTIGGRVTFCVDRQHRRAIARLSSQVPDAVRRHIARATIGSFGRG